MKRRTASHSAWWPSSRRPNDCWGRLHGCATAAIASSTPSSRTRSGLEAALGPSSIGAQLAGVSGRAVRCRLRLLAAVAGQSPPLPAQHRGPPLVRDSGVHHRHLRDHGAVRRGDGLRIAVLGLPAPRLRHPLFASRGSRRRHSTASGWASTPTTPPSIRKPPRPNWRSSARRGSR